MHPNYTPPWRTAEKRYFTLRDHFWEKFGQRVHKISVNTRRNCPNVDGTVGVGGCIFCDNESFSPSRRADAPPEVLEQLDRGIERVSRRFDCNRFIAYFQPGTNTYAPVDQLRAAFEQALTHPQVVGLAVSTRPDCASDDVIDLLSDLAKRTFLSVEYGLQTIHDRVLDWLGRGHHYDAFLDAVERSRSRGFSIGAHVILGLPGESHDDMLSTGRELARLKIDSVKLHNLYAVSNTRLADEVGQGNVRLPDRDEFVRIVVDILEILPPTTVIQRIGGDAPAPYLVGPAWCQDKPAPLAAVDEELRRRDSWQGKKYKVK